MAASEKDGQILRENMEKYGNMIYKQKLVGFYGLIRNHSCHVGRLAGDP